MTYTEATAFIAGKNITLSKGTKKFFEILARRGEMQLPQSGRRGSDTRALQDLEALGLIERIEGAYIETIKLK